MAVHGMWVVLFFIIIYVHDNTHLNSKEKKCFPCFSHLYLHSPKEPLLISSDFSSFSSWLHNPNIFYVYFIIYLFLNCLVSPTFPQGYFEGKITQLNFFSASPGCLIIPTMKKGAVSTLVTSTSSSHAPFSDSHFF